MVVSVTEQMVMVVVVLSRIGGVGDGRGKL